MNILCENPCQTCTPFVGGASSPADPDYPFINLSSEAADVDRFFGRRFTPPGWQPPLGGAWFSIGCLGFCVSEISQEDADLCALAQATECVSVNWPEVVPNPGPNDEPPFVEVPRELFGNNPQFCQFICPDGSPFTFTTAAGIFLEFRQSAADIMAYTYACNKAAANRLCMGTLLPANACVGVEYVGSISVSSTNLPVTFGLVGSLPPGYVMSQNTSTLFINGNTEDAGDYSFTITATDTLGNVMQKLCAITVFGITNTSQLPDATLNSAYSNTLVTGGTPPGPTTTFTVISGALPDGLTLNSSTGEISGTPTTEGAYQITVRTTSGTFFCDKVFDLFVQPEGAFDFVYTTLQSDTLELSAASVNGFDFLAGLPLDGTLIGTSIQWLWTVTGGAQTYAMAFQGEDAVVEAGTYRVTINNAILVPATVTSPMQITVWVNGGFVFIYNIDFTTGPLFIDLPLVPGDILKVDMGADGSFAPAGSYQVDITAVKL